MYRVWYSTESFADYIIDHTDLSNYSLIKSKMFESDANHPKEFFTMPDHIRKILYLDAPDLIVEKDNEPVFSIEVTTEAGTGHNAFQRFARIAASAENDVPSFYIYPEAVIISRKNEIKAKWDSINPLIFKALNSIMDIYKIPALLYYFPSDYRLFPNDAERSPNFGGNKGLNYDKDFIAYSGCPDSQSDSMIALFEAINELIELTEQSSVLAARSRLLGNLIIRKQKEFMNDQFIEKSFGRSPDTMSPLSATAKIPTEYLLNYLSRYESNEYEIGELLKNRKETVLYQVNAKFRGDPYPGALAAIDYLRCREGKTYEERRYNLVLVFGEVLIDDNRKTIVINNKNGSTITDFTNTVKQCSKFNLLTKDYHELKSSEIPRYMMQIRYGSTYSKVKHIRVYSYFSDAILFPNGALWRDA